MPSITGTGQVQKTSQVEERLSFLHENILTCKDLSEQIYTKLEKVLREPEPIKEQSDAPDPPMVSLAYTIYNMSDQVNTINNRLQSILDRLEL